MAKSRPAFLATLKKGAGVSDAQAKAALAKASKAALPATKPRGKGK